MTSALKEYRTRKGITQKAAAAYLGVTRPTYARYEQHPETMSIQQGRALCAFFGCKWEQIFLPVDVS